MPKKAKASDSNQWAAHVVSGVTGLPSPTGLVEQVRAKHNAAKNPAAVALGQLGGLKGGKARAKALSPKQRSEIARKGAKVRWSTKNRIQKMVQQGKTSLQIAKALGMPLDHVSPKIAEVRRESRQKSLATA